MKKLKLDSTVNDRAALSMQNRRFSPSLKGKASGKLSVIIVVMKDTQLIGALSYMVFHQGGRRVNFNQGGAKVAN